MRQNKEKIERALGTRLFLKPIRGQSSKSAVVRKPYPPGNLGARKKRKNISEYKKQLQEKRRIQIAYGLNDKQTKKIFESGRKPEEIFEDLERRLDNVVFKLGLAISKQTARQFVSHGHIRVNGRKVKSSSYRVKKGDIISVSQSFLKSKIFQNRAISIKNFNPPSWLKLDKNKFEGEVINNPNDELNFDFGLVINYYSK